MNDNNNPNFAFELTLFSLHSKLLFLFACIVVVAKSKLIKLKLK